MNLGLLIVVPVEHTTAAHRLQKGRLACLLELAKRLDGSIVGRSLTRYIGSMDNNTLNTGGRGRCREERSEVRLQD